MTPAEELTDLPDWDAPPVASAQRTPVGAVLGASAAYGAVMALVAWLVGPLGAIVWLVVGALLATNRALAARGEGARLLDGARRLEHRPRLQRLVTGIAGDLGIEPPDVWVYEDGTLNAFVTRTSDGTAIAVAAGLPDAVTLTELDAVVTHCLVRLKTGLTGQAWARLVPGWTRRVPACAPAAHDIRAAAVTRYPPALAAAIRRCEPRDGRDQGLWFVPRASGECAPQARAAALEDL